MRIPISPQFYKSKSLPFSAQQLINMFMNTGVDGTKNNFKVSKIDGAEKVVEILETSSINNFYKKGDFIYAIGENTLYKIDCATYTVATVGSIGQTDGKVYFDELNQYVLMLKPDGALWVYDDELETLADVTDSDYPSNIADTTVSSMTVLTQRIIVSVEGTQQFYWSALGDPFNWEALNFASKESNPDDLVKVISKTGELWLIGEVSTEVWQPTNNIDLPYARVGTTVVSKGTYTKDSVAEIDDTLIWLADDSSVYIAQGYSFQKISTDAIDEELANYDLTGDVNAFTYKKQGHSFYLLTVCGYITLVYDLTTGFWHQRQTKGRKDWRIQNVIFDGDKVLGCDKYEPNIYQLKTDVYTENGEEILWNNTFPVIYDDDKRIIFDKLLIDIDNGKGTEDNVTPYVEMEFSNDGGYIFKGYQKVSIGKIGEYKNRAVFRRLGQARNRVFRIKGSSKTQVNISGAFVDGRIGEK